MKNNKGKSVAELEKLIRQKEAELFELQKELEQAEEYRHEQTKKFIAKANDDDQDWR